MKNENLEIEEVLFTNGPVQMESLSSDGWDIGCTGVGGYCRRPLDMMQNPWG